MFESPVRTKSKLIDPSNDRPINLHSPGGARGHDESRSAVLAENRKFLLPLSFSALARDDPFELAIRILKL